MAGGDGGTGVGVRRGQTGRVKVVPEGALRAAERATAAQAGLVGGRILERKGYYILMDFNISFISTTTCFFFSNELNSTNLLKKQGKVVSCPLFLIR